MIIKKAQYLISSVKLSGCPAPDRNEYAFIGRSNVGKSSLINMLTGHGKLAKISSTPGKTQMINHFSINDNWYLVDLPGYGYAKVSKTQRQKWWKMIDQYLMKRDNLVCVFVLIDSRISPQKSDMEFLSHLGGNSIPLCIVYTKTDKISNSKLIKNLNVIKEKLAEYWEELPIQFISSAKSGRGRDEILDYIDQINKSNKK